MTQTPIIERKLTTILSADAANYSGKMARDEVGTITALRKAREVIDSQIAMRGGRIANTSGDGLIAEFPSVVEAVATAINIQRSLNSSKLGLDFRIGLHLGDVIVEGDDLLGDGVNLASRLQELAPEGGIFASQQIVDHAAGRLASASFRRLGPRAAKHMPQELSVFAIEAKGVTPGKGLEKHDPTAPPQSEPDKRKARAAFLVARDKFLLSLAGTVAFTLWMGPWVIFAFAPMNLAFAWKWLKLKREQDAAQL